MKGFLKSLAAAAAVLAFVAGGLAVAQNVDNYTEQGGSRDVIGGSLDVVSGGELDIESGGALKIAGTAVTSSAAELNVLDGFTGDVADLNTVDPSQKVTFVDDFLAGALEGRISSTAGSGTGNAVLTVVANSTNGTATVTSASDDGTHAANCSAVSLDQTNFRADSGGVALEVRGSIDDVSEAAFFAGFSDTISTTVELPIYLAAGDAIDSDADNAAGVVYDVDADTDEWAQGGVKATTDTSPTFAGSAPTDGTTFTVRVELSAAGAVTGYIDGTAIGTATANAVTATTSLTPYIAVCNRSANQVVATLDYVWVQSDR